MSWSRSPEIPKRGCATWPAASASWSGIAIGMGLGVTLDNFPLGISLAVCLGVALSYALGATRKTGEE
ncbi:zinc transporter ZupT [Nonomuraea thailandensis]|uniref:Zinc transporter ZupT n=3 Tax=Nonomuraea thailandensis TaxID=1188745 RepID=A0A9X2KA73_9ACTN|nr:hypothetical protein [Nonomuraea thailandensis]MCP2365828.1 zinc transporter ZupT [Nonomuraea thailandensis]